MSKYVWFLAAIFVLSCSKNGEIQVKGIVEHGARSMIYLDELGLREVHKVDSFKLKRDGSFILKDRIEYPTFYNLHLGDRNIIPLLLQPSDRVDIVTSDTGFSSKYKLTGSVESQKLLDLNRHMSKTRKSLDSLTNLYDKNQEAGEEILAELQSAYNEIIENQRRYNIQFVIENLTSMASIYALYQKMDDNTYVLNTTRDVQLLKITSVALDTLYPESEYVQSLKRDAENLEEEIQRRNLARVIESAANTSMPDIRLPDPYGDSISLSSFRGNVILLSFWASWHAPSENLNQRFLSLYEKYHKRGFEIYQVSFDSELRKWMRAIQFDELPWINVSELSYPESAVASLYNVTELPAYFLIDRDGSVTVRNPDMIVLDRRIENLLNKN